MTIWDTRTILVKIQISCFIIWFLLIFPFSLLNYVNIITVVPENPLWIAWAVSTTLWLGCVIIPINIRLEQLSL